MFAFSFGPYIWPKLLSTDLFVIDYTPGWFSSLEHYNWSHGYLWFVNLALSGSWARLTRENGTLTFGTPECMVCLMYHLVTWCLGNTFKICAQSSFFFLTFTAVLVLFICLGFCLSFPVWHSNSMMHLNSYSLCQPISSWSLHFISHW